MIYTDDKEKAFENLQICSIIKVCGVHGVKSIKFKDIKIEFFPRVNTEKPIPPVSEQIPIVQDSTTKDSIAETEDSYFRDREVEFKAEELAIMQIADPSKYEELLANPELLQEFSRDVETAEGDTNV